MIAAARPAGVVLIVGKIKRFDPAYESAPPLVAGRRDLRPARITTLEVPLPHYVC